VKKAGGSELIPGGCTWALPDGTSLGMGTDRPTKVQTMMAEAQSAVGSVGFAEATIGEAKGFVVREDGEDSAAVRLDENRTLEVSISGKSQGDLAGSKTIKIASLLLASAIA
jgi:hypothetical protein